jgi:hypothetical protein
VPVLQNAWLIRILAEGLRVGKGKDRLKAEG